MKKIVGIFITMMIVAIMATMAYGEMTDSIDLKDYIWIELIAEDYDEAKANGSFIPEVRGYIYEGIVYTDTECWMNINPRDFGIETEDEYWKMDQAIEYELEKVGIKNASVNVRRVGKDYNGEWIYDLEMLTMYNLNEFENMESDVFGSGYVKDDFVYWGIRCITHMHAYD